MSMEHSQFGVIFLLINQLGLGEKVKMCQSRMQEKNASRTSAPFVCMYSAAMGCLDGTQRISS